MKRKFNSRIDALWKRAEKRWEEANKTFAEEEKEFKRAEKELEKEYDLHNNLYYKLGLDKKEPWKNQLDIDLVILNKTQCNNEFVELVTYGKADGSCFDLEGCNKKTRKLIMNDVVLWEGTKRCSNLSVYSVVKKKIGYFSPKTGEYVKGGKLLNVARDINGKLWIMQIDIERTLVD